MSSQLELEESNDNIYEDDTMHRPSKSTTKNKSQEKLFPSKVSEEVDNTSSKPWQFKYNKTGIPKVDSNTSSKPWQFKYNKTGIPKVDSNTSSKPWQFQYNKTTIPKIDGNMEISSTLYHNNRINTSALSLLDDSFKFVDLTQFMSNNILVNNDNYQTAFNDFFAQISNNATASENTAICHASLPSSSSEIIEIKSDTLENNGSESFKNQPDISNISDINFDFNVLNIDNETKIVDTLEPLELLNPIEMYTNNETDIENKQCDEIHTENEDDDTNTLEIVLNEEFDSYCPHYLDDSFASEPSTDIEKENEEITVLESSKSVNSIDGFTNYEQEKYSEKVVDIEENLSIDLRNKENPLYMNELISTNTLDNVEVQCLKEFHPGESDHIIEIYGFSPKLKAVDLLTQFKARKFKNNYVEVISIDDTHALAVFENSYIASCALNTFFGIMKTRSLKNAIQKSKINAQKIIALSKTQPKTCNSVANRLVSNPLGLKIHALLANGKEIHDTQHKHDII